MGLPSGLLWAKANIGATSPEQPGLYFSWGNSPGHAEGSDYDFSQVTYNETTGAAIEDNLTLAEDMARLSLGSPWRMPTKEDFQELVDNCTSKWTVINGQSGVLFTSNINGISIFLPAAGYYDGLTLKFSGLSGIYFSSSYYSNVEAHCLSFNNTHVYPDSNGNRYYGFSVRAVFLP